MNEIIFSIGTIVFGTTKLDSKRTMRIVNEILLWPY